MRPNPGFIILALFLAVVCVKPVSAQRIFMTGDSHVKSKIYPNMVEENLREKFPELEFGWWGKNGICFHSFNTNREYFDTIISFRPDILIVHLGTNGAYGNGFTRKKFRHEMEQFYTTIKTELPELRLVFVTPFTNKMRVRGKKKGRWVVNPHNREAAQEILAFAEEHPDTWVIDNNGKEGLGFLKTRGLIRRDNVHLTETGYRALGNDVAEDILASESLCETLNSFIPL